MLPDADAILEWQKGTALLPVFERLDPAATEAFLAEFRDRLRARYPGSPVLYPFRRILFSALRPPAR